MKGDSKEVQDYLNNLYQKCIDKWGYTSQLLMVVEELNELSVEILHMIRTNKKHVMDDVFKELVDALFMLDQFIYMLDIDEKVLRILRDMKIIYVKGLLKEDQS